MIRNNKKGFTIIELVIVIAVIAILAAVLIPTFSNIIQKSKDSAMLQELTTARTTLLTYEDAQLDEDYTYYFIYTEDAEDVRIFTFDGTEPVEVATADKPTLVKGAAAGDTIYAGDDAQTTVTWADGVADDAKAVVEDADLKNVVIFKKANPST